jgi:hypothetical protein
MPTPKDIKNLLKATQGTKAVGKATDLEELLGTLPKGSKAQQLEAELMFKRLAEEQAAAYARTQYPTETGRAALAKAKKTLGADKDLETELAAKKAKLEEGKKNFISPSQIKERLYHATPKDFKEFQGEGFDPTISGHATWLGYDPEYQAAMHNISGGRGTPFREGVNVMPVHVQARSPLVLDDPLMIDWARQVFAGGSGEFPHLMPKEWVNSLKESGYDSIIFAPPGSEPKHQEVIMLDPKRIKSAIGNEGTYDIENPDITKADGGAVHMAGGGPLNFMKAIQKLSKEMSAAEKAGDIEAVLKARESLNDMIRYGVNDPMMPRAKPLTQAELNAYAERMAPQVAGELTRGKKGAQTIAGKTQQQFKREKDLSVRRSVMPGKTDPMEPLPLMTLEDQKGSVLLGLPGDQTLARMNLHGIGDVDFETSVGLHGGPRYGDDEKLWASNLGAATGLLSAADRASQQFGNSPVIASYLKMPSGLPFAQHYLESLLQYQRPDELSKAAHSALVKDIKEGYINPQGKRVTFPDFPGFGDLGAVAEMTRTDSGLRKHIADRLEKGKKYGLLPAGDVQFAVSHPELTNLETGASGFTLGELSPQQTLKESEHPTYSHDIAGKVLGQTEYPIPYDLLYRDQLNLIRQNPYSPEFNTLKLLGARQPIDEQLVNEINEYQERMRKLLGRKDGGGVHMAGGGQTFPLQDQGGDSENEFHPAPLQIPQKLTDLAAALKAQYEREKRSLSKPGATTDILARGVVAPAIGTPADIIGMGGEAIDWLQTKIPGLRKPASVMDTEPTAKPAMGYAPKFPIGPEGTMPYGTEYAQELMEKAGITTDTKRPLTEMASMFATPAVAAGAVKAGKVLAPTAADMLESQLRRAGMIMDVAPEGKAGKIKAPANDLGFYNPVEKAALNLQRKKGAGNAFVADLKKQPGVNDERLAELGLGDLASRPEMTREEIIAAAEANRIPLRETVGREVYNTERAEELRMNRNYIQGSIEKIEREFNEAKAAGHEHLAAERELKLAQMKSSLQKVENEQNSLKPSKFGPEAAPDYNLPGGKNYREIRVGLPAKESERQSMQGWSVKTIEANPYTNQRTVEILDPNGTVMSTRHGFRGSDGSALYDYASGSQTRDAAKENFFHKAHHGDEPNVLFHLRVADHVDSEGKKGLLIDELQSDWHQQGRKMGYGKKAKLSDDDMLDYLGMTRDDWDSAPDEIQTRLRGQYAAERAKQGGVPDAPFKDNWYQLGLKRAIKEAADTGMDRVYLTKGARQNERYNLSKQVSKIEYDEMGNLRAYNKDGAQVIAEPVPKDKLADYVGKEMAKKIVENSEKRNNARLKYRELLKSDAPNDVVDVAYKEYLSHPTEYSGLDLDVGGAGMEQWYDKNYKNFLDKYARQHGARLGETTLPAASKKFHQIKTADMEKIVKSPGWIDDFLKLSGDRLPLSVPDDEYQVIFNKLLPKYGPEHMEKVYYIDITPAMKESARKGQSYKDGGAVDLQAHLNNVLSKHFAEGGAAYNTNPDMSDGGLFVQAPAFANGGAVKSIWTVN